MEAKRCPQGHFYDAERFASCPECNKGAANETMPIGSTMPLSAGSYDPVPPTEPVTPNVSFSDPGPTIPTDKSDFVSDPPIDDLGVTKAMGQDYIPTVGWLVCIRGPHKGQDFRLVTGYNRIGRDASMAINLFQDTQVTRKTHAIVGYDPASRLFFAKGEENMIYINNQFIMGQQELHDRDVIKIGTCELMFIPLCGDLFSWDE